MVTDPFRHFFTGEGIERTTPGGVGAPTAPAPDRWVRVKAAVVGAGFVVAIWFGMRLWQPLGEGTAPPIAVRDPVLAVLPFDDFSPEGDQAYFADGLPAGISERTTRCCIGWRRSPESDSRPGHLRPTSGEAR